MNGGIIEIVLTGEATEDCVDISENAEFQNFYETVAHNAGVKMKWFTDIDIARDWLKRKQKKQ